VVLLLIVVVTLGILPLQKLSQPLLLVMVVKGAVLVVSKKVDWLLKLVRLPLRQKVLVENNKATQLRLTPT
jgi:hypothetical protein